MIQLLGNGRGQYGSTRNVGLWASAGKAKIRVVSAVIKNAHLGFRMISSFLVRRQNDRAAGGSVALHTFALHLADNPLYAISGGGPHDDRVPAQSGSATLASDAIYSYSCARCRAAKMQKHLRQYYE